MLTRIKLGCIVIVEGKNDSLRLKKNYEVETIETGGSALNNTKIALIKRVAAMFPVLILTDSDHAGRRIRSLIQEQLPNAQHAFLRDGVSLEDASDEELAVALNNLVSFNSLKETLSWRQYLILFPTAAQRRLISSLLAIPTCNNRTLFRWLNMMGIDESQLKTMLWST